MIDVENIEHGYTDRVPSFVMSVDVRGAERYIMATFTLPTKEIIPALDLKAKTRGWRRIPKE